MSCERKFVPKRILKKSTGPRKAAFKRKGFIGGTISCPTCGEAVGIDPETGGPDFCMTC